MIKILVISDSHKNVKTIEGIVKLESPDCFIFCGDMLSDLKNLNFKKSVFAVKGNWDFKSTEKSEKVIELNGKRILITHGNKYNIKKGLEPLKCKAIELKCNIVCYGHTHKQKLDKIESITFINPGFANKGFYALLFLDNNKEIVQLKNLNIN